MVIAIVTDNYFVTFVVVFATFVLGIIAFFKYRYLYWKNCGIPTCKTEFFWGSIKDVVFGKKPLSIIMKEVYDEARSRNLPHIGSFYIALPIYNAVDPDIIKHILQVDFDVFTNRGVYYNERDDPLSANLFTLESKKWRNLRQKLSPTFTSGQMKYMFTTLLEKSDGLTKLIDEHVGNKAINIKEAMARYSTDVIASCAFGITCDTFTNPDNEFRKCGKQIFEADLENFIRRTVSQSFSKELLRRLGFLFFKSKSTKFFRKVVNDTVSYRELNDVYRKDFMQLLLQIKNKDTLAGTENIDYKKDSSLSLTMDELAAQAFLFYLAGFETSSTAASYVMYELALNQDIQDKVRQEIRDVLKKYGEEVTYDAVIEMKYMQQVIDESLRKYPPVPQLDRTVGRDYRIPGTDKILKKGNHVHIAVLGLHRDPEYYPDPDKFDPERFNEENKKARKQLTYLPFGDGPRICIGLRFGLQSKVGLIAMLKNHKVTMNARTKVPCVFDPTSIILSTYSPIWLDVARVE